MIKPSIKLKLNNNPFCETEIESTVKHQVWKYINRPYIFIEGYGFENCTTSIKVLNKGDMLYSGDISIIDGTFNLKFELGNVLDSVNYLDVIVGEHDFSILVKLNKLYGTVKYYDGTPVKNPIINCRFSDIVSVGDELGNFEILLNGVEKDIGVFDKGYSKDSLEPWLYNVDLKDDLKLDIKMDKAEVYGINVWSQYASDYIHFVPMSLTRTIEAMKKGFDSEMSLASCEEIKCYLSKDNVSVYRDDKLMEIVSFSEVKDFLGYHNGNPIYRNSYVVCIPRGSRNDRAIKIVIESCFKSGEDKIIDKGEGYYIMR